MGYRWQSRGGLKAIGESLCPRGILDQYEEKRPCVPTIHLLYGVVEPETGWQFTQKHAKLNNACCQTSIDALLAQVGDVMAVIQLNGATEHRAKVLESPENLDSAIAVAKFVQPK